MQQEPDRRDDNDIEAAAGDAQQASADAPEQASADTDQQRTAEPGEFGAVGDEQAPDEAMAAGAAQDPAQLTMLLEDARAKADQAHDQLLRTRAEMENMSRRQAKELENAHKFALDGFVRELLQVRDSLELGHAAAQAPDADVTKLCEGTDLTLKLLGDVMAKFGVERVDPEGQPFNPDQHQAMSIQPRADLPPNTVTNVIQSGYLLNGRLVRPALVMVSSQA